MQTENSLIVKPEYISRLMKAMEDGLEHGHQWICWERPEDSNDVNVFYCCQNRASAENFCWNPRSDPRMMAARLIPLYQASKAAVNNNGRKGSSAGPVAISLEGIEKIQPEKTRQYANYSALVKQLAEMGIARPTVNNQIVEALLQNRERFTIVIHSIRRHEPYLTTIRAGVKNGWYAFDKFSVSGIPVKKSDHGGIDLVRLQQDMAGINWNAKGSNVPELEKMSKVMLTLHDLSRDDEGIAIAETLFFKYISSDIYRAAKVFPDERAKFELKQDFPMDGRFPLTLEEAINLYEGRAVFKEAPVKDGKQEKAWFVLHPDQKDEEGNRLLGQLHPEYSENLLQTLQVLKADLRFLNEIDELQQAFHRGNEVTGILQIGPIERELRIRADILHGAVVATDPSGVAMEKSVMPGSRTPSPGQAFTTLYNSQLSVQPERAEKKQESTEIGYPDSTRAKTVKR